MANKRRKFYINMTAEIEIDPKVIAQGMSREFAEYVYELDTPERVAEHIAYNLVQGTSLDMLDGLANLNPKLVKLKEFRVDCAEEVDEWV